MIDLFNDFLKDIANKRMLENKKILKMQATGEIVKGSIQDEVSNLLFNINNLLIEICIALKIKK